MALLDTKWRPEPETSTAALSRTFDFLNELARSGLTVASYQPSPEMIDAGARAGNISAAQAKTIYLAMISHYE